MKPVTSAGPTRSARPRDDINRPVWSRSASEFEHQLGWLDRGEEQALMRVADEVRGGPLLDLGVGAGRSTSLLRMLSADYIGVDYTPAMVETCPRHFPSERFEIADARDLAQFPSGHFALALALALFTFENLTGLQRVAFRRLDRLPRMDQPRVDHHEGRHQAATRRPTHGISRRPGGRRRSQADPSTLSRTIAVNDDLL